MKRSRLLTAAVVAAVAAGGSTLIATGTANADTANPTTEWVNTPAQFSATTGITPGSDGWYISTSDDSGTAALAFGPSGLSTTGAEGVGIEHAIDFPASDLASTVQGGTLVSTGEARLIVTLTDPSNPNTFEELEAEDTGAAALAPTALWTAFGSFSGVTATPSTLADLQTAITTSAPDATTAAYGLVLSFPVFAPTLSLNGAEPLLDQAAPAAATGDPATVSAIELDGDTTYFTPTPSALTISPSTTTVSGFGKGVTVSGSGFFPGETVSTGYGTGAEGDELPTTFVADANGNVSGTLPGPATITPLTYTLTLIGETSGIAEFNSLVVTADPAVVAPVATPVRATATFTG